MSDTPNTNKIFTNSVPYVQDGDGNYAVPVANPDGTPIIEADVSAVNTARTTATQVLPVQEVDPAGNVDSRETAGADGVSNASVRRRVVSWLMGFNGTIWDRIRTAVVSITSTLTGFLNTIPYGIYTAADPTMAEGQGGPLRFDSKQRVLVNPAPAVNTVDAITAFLATNSIMNGTTALTPKFALANVAASQTDSNIITAVANKKIRILQMINVAGATATNIVFNTKPAGAGTAITPTFANGINGGEVLPFSPVGWFETASGEGLTATTGAGATTGILIVYVEV